MEIKCPYCQQLAEFVDSSEVYGRSYGMIYLCRSCNAYVGTHKRTNKPLGRLANAELRHWKIEAHRVFDKLWKDRTMSRRSAYKYMQKVMQLPADLCHIGMFDVEQCKLLIERLENERTSNST